MIDEPKKGTAPLASWATEVTRGVNRYLASLNERPHDEAANRRNKKIFHPFEVVGTVNEDNGAAFLIYLPYGSIVSEDTNVTAQGVEAVSGVDGLYAIDDSVLGDDIPSEAADAIPLYLIVYEYNGATRAYVTTDENEVTDGEIILMATIANIFASECGEKTFGSVSTQLIRSSVVIGKRGEGSTPPTAEEFLFEYKLKVIRNQLCVHFSHPGVALCVNGSYVSIGGIANEVETDWYYVSSTAQNRTVYLNVTSGTNGYEASISTSSVQGAVWSIVVGYLNTFGGAGGTSWNTIDQIVVGALVMNSGTGSGGGSSQTRKIDVVTDVSYSASGTDAHKLIAAKQKVEVLSTETASQPTKTVFTATPHSDEHSVT